MTISEERKIAREAAADAFVLLKNNGALPLKEKKVALYGVGSYFCNKMGTGSGDMLGIYPVQIFEGLEEQGFEVSENPKKVYTNFVKNNPEIFENFNTEWGKICTHFDEPVFDILPDCETAVFTISRGMGESLDMQLEKGEYYLTDNEEKLLFNVRRAYKTVIVIYNIPNFITPNLPIIADAVLFIGMPGQEAGNAVADIISGKVNPSGALAATWAKRYEDYPTSNDFYSEDKGPLYPQIERFRKEPYEDILYNEGIYVGYRYFDSFGIKPFYGFGYGLSYTEFKTEPSLVEKFGTDICITVSVKNTGLVDGKTTVMCFITAPEEKIDKPSHELCAFEKTGVIKAGESEEVCLWFDLCDFASYSVDDAAYILEAGRYILSVGDSLDTAVPFHALTLSKEKTVFQTKNRFKPNILLDLINKPYANDTSVDVDETEIDTDEIATEYSDNDSEYQEYFTEHEEYNFAEVMNGNISPEEFVAALSNDRLGNFLNGAVFGGSEANAVVGSMSRQLMGAAGETFSDEKLGLPTSCVADGPSGIRLGFFGQDEKDYADYVRTCICFPSAFLLACSFNTENCLKMGEAVRGEMERLNIDGWLAPGINIHRDPMNGRNFEYFSEDPILAGVMAQFITYGVQYDENGNDTKKYVTVKHFCCNDRETYRLSSNSVVDERTLREIYLKNFRIACEAAPLAVMTSYNLLNGKYTACTRELVTNVLRDEWGYDGIVMSDWNDWGEAKLHSYAGCDLIMPGIHKKSILEALNDGTLSRADAQHSALNLINLLLKTN